MRLKPDNGLDPLAVEQLPPVEGMELDHRTQILSPKEIARAARWMIVAVSVWGAILALGLRIVAELTSTTAFLWVAIPLIVIQALYLIVVRAPAFETVGCLLVAPVIWLLSQLAAAELQGLIWLLALAFSLPFCHAMITHHAYWMHAHPQLQRTTRLKWRSAWPVVSLWHCLSRVWAPNKHTPDTNTPLVAAEIAERARYDFGYVYVIVAFLAALLVQLLIPRPFFGGICAVFTFSALLLIYGGYQAAMYDRKQSIGNILARVCHGWSNWLTYNLHDTPAPGVFRSPHGNARRRQTSAYCATILTALAVVPLCAYFPLMALIWGPGPWEVAAAKSWAFSEVIRDHRLLLEPEPRAISDAYLRQLSATDRERFDAAFKQQQRVGGQRPTSLPLDSHESYLLATLQGISRGEPFFFISFAISVLASALAAPALLFLTSFAVGARVLLHHHATLEGDAPADGDQTQPAARYHRKRVVSRWQAYAERLAESEFSAQNAEKQLVREADHLFLGFNPEADYPVLLDARILAEHAHITGDSGSGKSALGIAPLVAQLIGRPQSSVVIIDLKGDPALFEGTRLAVKAANLRQKNKNNRIQFRWFTNVPGRTTFGFNPFLQSHMEHMTLSQKASVLLQSLGLDYGEGYGTSYYSAVHRDTLVKVLRDDPRINSFRALQKYFVDDLRSRRHDLHIDKKQLEEAAHLYTVVDSLSEFDALSITPESVSKEILEYQIDMPAVVSRPHVIYFYLHSALEETAVREIAKLALHSLLSAAVHRGRSGHQVYVFIDEFQQVVSQNLEIILRQARSAGMAAILANQTISDLKRRDVDLIPTVQGNTRYRQVFSASDQIAQEMLSRASGESIYYLASAEMMASYLLADQVAKRFGQLMPWASPTDSDPEGSLSVTEHIGPRMRPSDILHYSDRERFSIVQVTRGRGLTQYGGCSFPMVSDFHITFKEFEQRADAPWPQPRPGTMIQAPSGVSDSRTKAAEVVAEVARTPHQKTMVQRLQDLHTLLEEGEPEK
ncbi:MAG: TraM recognition domain-containing protein [Phycisphaerae bacterium]|nr:TraM recognition domain-containing protein [Phycisphaerae bacterium]